MNAIVKPRDLMEYKGYYGSVHFDEEEKILYGKLEFIRASVSYHGNAKTIRKAFEEAVDDYLDFCEQKGFEAEKPFKGNFNIRIGEELHRKATLAALRKGVSLNKFAQYAFENAINMEFPELAKD